MVNGAQTATNTRPEKNLRERKFELQKIERLAVPGEESQSDTLRVQWLLQLKLLPMEHLKTRATENSHKRHQS